MTYKASNPESPSNKQALVHARLWVHAGDRELRTSTFLTIIRRTCDVTSKRACEMYLDSMIHDGRVQRVRRGWVQLVEPTPDRVPARWLSPDLAA